MMCASALGAYRLSDKRPKAATWLLLVGMALGFSAIAALYPSSLAVAAGVWWWFYLSLCLTRARLP